MIPYIPPQPQEGICYVNRVIDGDTIECDKFKIRLCGIDSPEKSQPFGAVATTKLTQLTLNKNVRLVTKTVDIYGRFLSEVWIGDRLINAEMVRAGLAYKYGSCPVAKTIFVNAEESAIALKLGIWELDQMRPWTYRRLKK